MPRKSFTPEQVIAKLRHIEVALANGKTLPQACKEATISTQTYYRWRKEYGGCGGQARRSRSWRRRTPD